LSKFCCLLRKSQLYILKSEVFTDQIYGIFHG
jgi:hypothetical protein